MTVISSFISTRWDKLGKLGGKATIANAVISAGAELATRNKEASFFEKVCSNLNVGADLLAAGLTFFCAGNPYVLGGVAAFYIGRALIRPIMTALSGGSLTDIGVDVGRGAMDVALNFSALKVGKLFGALSKANTAVVARAESAVGKLLVTAGPKTPDAMAKLTKTVDLLSDEAATASKMLKSAENSLETANTGLKSSYRAALKDLKTNHPEVYTKYKDALTKDPKAKIENFTQYKNRCQTATTLRSTIDAERKALGPLLQTAKANKIAAEAMYAGKSTPEALKAIQDATKVFTDLQTKANSLRAKSIALRKGVRKINFAKKDIEDFTKWNTNRQVALSNANKALSQATNNIDTITENVVSLQKEALEKTLRVDKRGLFKDTMEVGFGKEQAAALGDMAQRSRAIPKMVTKKAENFADGVVDRFVAAKEKVAKVAAERAARGPVPAGFTENPSGLVVPWSVAG